MEIYFYDTPSAKTLIENERLREQLGKAARKNVENFDWHVLARSIEKYLMK